MYIAQANIALFRKRLDEADMEGFVAQIQPLNQTAENADGFVWRFTEAYSPRTACSPWNSPLLFFNMSVWTDRDSLDAYVTSPDHCGMMQHRTKWLEPVQGPSTATWWIDEAARPTIDDAIIALSGQNIDHQASLLHFATQREKTVWQSVIYREASGLARLFTDDYAEVTLSGKRVFKDQIVEESPQTDEISAYAMDSEKVIALADGTFLLSYHVTIEGTFKGEAILPKDRWATSIWRRDNGCWKCCFFQQSPYPVQAGR